jgi:integrase
MTKRRNPFPGVTRTVDRHGTLRWRFRRGGVDCYLPGPYASAEFRAAYDAACKARPVRSAAKPGTLSWLIESYLASRKFSELAPASRASQRRQFDWLRQTAGHLPFAMCRTRDVAALMDRKDGPTAANTVAKRLSSLFAYAQSLDLMTHNPARHVERRKVTGDGYHTATEAEVAAYRARHPTGTRERLALELAINIGPARQDLCRLGWQNVAGATIRYARHKTKVEAELPILPELAAELRHVPRDRLLFLVTAEGRPFTVAGFGNAFRDWCDQAGLTRCTVHSFRKFAATRLAEAGASEFQIMAVLAHSTPKEAARYAKKASRKALGAGALALLPGAEREQDLSNPLVRLDKRAIQDTDRKPKNA